MALSGWEGHFLERERLSPEEEKNKAEVVEALRFTHACDLGQVTSHLRALVSAFIKWGW